ncbi:MAG: PQQ-binding-like beta-propeller repeat protein, partial [Planctomycetales bacterium]|nr:PQQ-binding-like beta-propeller repeat protein [Planctomycetales bacterium]
IVRPPNVRPPNVTSPVLAESPESTGSNIGEHDFGTPVGSKATNLGSQSAKASRGLLGGLIRRKKKQPALGGRQGQNWDSPLMLLGGGALILLVAGGIFLYFYLNRGSGDEMFELAEESYRGQSYTQAIGGYQTFLKKFPEHPKASLARVRTGMARLRQHVDSGSNWNASLETANAQLPIIKTEEAFGEARTELSTLLTNIYDGFVTQAENAKEVSEKQTLLDQANAALALVDNPEYLPTSVRRIQQAKIEEITDRTTLVLRDINRDNELQLAVQKIREATTSHDILLAYDIRKELIARYPGLEKNPQLRDAVLAITQAELAKVTTADAPITAVDTPRTLALPRRIVVADRRLGNEATLPGQIAVVLTRGAVYGLNANDGSVLWRHWLGFASTDDPLRLSADPNSDVVVVNRQTQELVRLAGKSGQTVWRLPLDQSFTRPAIVGNQLFLSTTDGRIVAADAVTGNVAKQAQLPQSQLAPLGVDPESRHIYAAGEHSSLYVFSADTLTCEQVVYVGHRPGSITVPPAGVSGYLFVCENGGTDSCQLHVYRPIPDGSGFEPAMDSLRLDGQVAVPLMTFGRRVFLTTDRGGHYVFDVDPANANEPVRILAQTLPSATDVQVQYPLVEGGQIFVAGKQLVRFELQASRGEMVRKWVSPEGDRYLGNLQLFQDVLIQTRQRRGSSAITVSALRVSVGRTIRDEGQELWSTDIAAPPALEARRDAQKRSVVVVSSAGTLWDITSQAMSNGLLNAASDRTSDLSSMRPVTTAINVDESRFVLTAKPPTRNVLLYDSSETDRLQEVTLRIPHDQLACELTALQGKLLACSLAGPIYLVDPQGSDNHSVLPYQPTLGAGASVNWIRPAISSETSPLIIAATQSGQLLALTVDDQPKPHLEASNSRELGANLRGNVAALGANAFVVVEGLTHDELQTVKLPGLEGDTREALPGKLVWGPEVMGELVLLATDTNNLVALNAQGQTAWSVPLEFGALAGSPVLIDERLLCTSVDGHVWQIATDKGQMIPWHDDQRSLDAGEPLAASATVVGKLLLLLGRDSTLYIAEMPTAAEAGRQP